MSDKHAAEIAFVAMQGYWIGVTRCALLPGERELLRTLATAAVRAASPEIRASERERIFRTPIVQRFEIDDCLLRCAGCGEALTENRIEHQAGCSEIVLEALLREEVTDASPS